MTDPIILTTYDWVPEGPRGHVRDVRIRWALDEAGLDYEVATTPFYDRGATHFQRQPFGQVPFLEDNGVKLFESGAILLHLGRKSEKLMPRDAQGEAETLEWVVASLNSMEMVTVPWWFLRVSGDPDNGLAGWMNQRFEKLESVLAERDWLAASRFTVADIMMADVLRIPMKLGALDDFPKQRAYVERVTARPAFKKAVEDQLAHFASADRARA